MIRPVVSLAVVGAVLAGVVGGAQALRPAPVEVGRQPELRTVPVESARLVCPRTRDTEADTNRLAIIAPAQAGPAATDDGSATLRALDPARPFPPLTLRSVGAVAVVDPRRVATDPVLTAAGPLAAGVVAEAAFRVDSGRNRGIAGARCVAPTTEFWFAGASTTAGRFGVLTMTNVDPLPATVDVSFANGSGAVDAPQTRGLVIPPGKATSLLLHEAVPDETGLLVHVLARAGRVGAFLIQRITYDGLPGGLDYIPPVEEPLRDAVLPGLPNGTGYRRVTIGNPGVDDAVVKVSLITSDGTFVPDGLGEVLVPSGSTKTVDITAGLGQQSGAVRLEADRPVIAAATADTGRRRYTGIGEFAWTAAVSPLSGPTPIGITSIGPSTSSIFLSAIGGDAVVAVRTVDTAGVVVIPPHRYAVTSERTVVLDLPKPVDRPYAVFLEVVEGSGSVYAARELLEFGARGPLYTIEPILSGRNLTVLRPVRGDVRISQRQ